MVGRNRRAKVVEVIVRGDPDGLSPRLAVVARQPDGVPFVLIGDPGKVDAPVVRRGQGRVVVLGGSGGQVNRRRNPFHFGRTAEKVQRPSEPQLPQRKGERALIRSDLDRGGGACVKEPCNPVRDHCELPCVNGVETALGCRIGIARDPVGQQPLTAFGDPIASFEVHAPQIENPSGLNPHRPVPTSWRKAIKAEHHAKGHQGGPVGTVRKLGDLGGCH